MQYQWLNDKSRKFLAKGYIDGQTAEQRIRDISDTAEKYLQIEGFADKFEDYMAKGFFSLASPIWANYGKARALPCSCNGSVVPDDMSGILDKVGEIGMMTKMGAGTSAYFGKIRPRGTSISSGGESSGPVHFMELFDTTTSVVSQSNIRRGSMAVYLDVEHPDILEFLQIRSEGNPIQDLSFGVCITDAWMRGLQVRDKDKLKIWAAIIRKRFETGYPYLFFTDTANRNAPQAYKDNGKTIHASNLCSEIALSSSEDESFVCVLSSMNLLHYDEWKDTDAVETLMYFLDTVTTEYISKTEDVPYMGAANRFSRRQRAVGLGVLGWHSLLQSKSVEFESMAAKFLNTEIFKLLNRKTLKASRELAILYGEPELMVGYGERMATRMAVAPTKSSSFILGQVSEGIEPTDSNYFVKKLAKGSFTFKNPFLKKVLKDLGKNTEEVWRSILERGGSVQHLSFLPDHQKNVFKTFAEISPKEVVIQASQRAPYIDQGQSLNIMIHPNTPPKEVSQLMIYAWENGVKGLYYQKGINKALMLSRSNMECKSCEG